MHLSVFNISYKYIGNTGNSPDSIDYILDISLERKKDLMGIRKTLAEIVDSIDSSNLTVIDDNDSVANCLDLRKDMRTDDDCMILRKKSDELSYLTDLVRVKTVGSSRIRISGSPIIA